MTPREASESKKGDHGCLLLCSSLKAWQNPDRFSKKSSKRINCFLVFVFVTLTPTESIWIWRLFVHKSRIVCSAAALLLLKGLPDCKTRLISGECKKIECFWKMPNCLSLLCSVCGALGNSFLQEEWPGGTAEETAGPAWYQVNAKSRYLKFAKTAPLRCV